MKQFFSTLATFSIVGTIMIAIFLIIEVSPIRAYYLYASDHTICVMADIRMGPDFPCYCSEDINSTGLVLDRLQHGPPHPPPQLALEPR